MGANTTNMVERRILFGMEKTPPQNTHQRTHKWHNQAALYTLLYRRRQNDLKSFLVTHKKKRAHPRTRKNRHRQPAEANRMKLLHRFHAYAALKNKH